MGRVEGGGVVGVVKNCMRDGLQRKHDVACDMEEVWLFSVHLIMWPVMRLLPAYLSSS